LNTNNDDGSSGVPAQGSSSETPDIWIKICGVTSVGDALMVEEAGANALGLNFAQQSPRYIEPSQARWIKDALVGPMELIGVFVDASFEHIVDTAKKVGLDRVQLHGDESPELLTQLEAAGVSAYKALRIATAADVARADSFGGDRILVDAKVEGAMGGTGETFDWSLIEALAQKRSLILAGGLHAKNVADSIASVRPFGVDTASGVESAPGVKDYGKVQMFIRKARKAAAS